MSDVIFLSMSKDTNKNPNLDSYFALQKKMKEGEKKKPVSRSSNNSSSNNPQRKSEKKDTRKEKTPEVQEVMDEDLHPDEPDRRYGDYYCRVCDSHMNSSEMWINHITGKRHIKNVKKGDTDSKYDDVDEESVVKHEIRNVKDPIIGLDYVQEIRRREPGVPPIFTCFLCHASISTVPLVIEHIIGLKHRSNFLRENDPDEFKLLEQTNLKKGLLEPIIAEKAAKFEEKHGRGEVKVKIEKPKPTSTYTSQKREHHDDIDNDWQPKKSSKSDNRAPTVWKSIDVRCVVPAKRDHREDNKRDKKGFFQHDDRSSYDEDRSLSRHDRYSGERDIYSRPLSHTPDHYDYKRVNDDYKRLNDDYDYKRVNDDYKKGNEDYKKIDDYKRMKDDYSRKADDYLRSVSPRRYSYERSPEQDLPSTSASKRLLSEKYSASEFSDARHYLDARTQEREQSITETSVKEPDAAQSTEENARNFMKQLYNLPPKLFLKIVVSKFENWTSYDLSKEEMEFLLKIDTCSKQIIKRSLPPAIQAMIKENEQLRAENVPSGSNTIYSTPPVQPAPPIPQSTSQATLASHKFTLDDINDLVFGARKASDLPTPSQQTSTYNPAPNVSVSSSHVSQTFTTSPQFPGNNYSHPGNSFNRLPANNYSTPASNFPPPASSLPYPGNFAPMETSPQSLYSSYTPNPNASIPGLTLTEKEGVQNDNSPQPSYRWSSSNIDRRDLFKRY